jgi:hypothetical protein
MRIWNLSRVKRYDLMKDASAFALSDVSIHAWEEFSAFSYISIDFCPHRMCEYMQMVDDGIMGPWWRMVAQHQPYILAYFGNV